tara:strand:+ start:238432 stop:238560 length:129 start_codon:yes stop_codon:yes gene_type:complete
MKLYKFNILRCNNNKTIAFFGNYFKFKKFSQLVYIKIRVYFK